MLTGVSDVFKGDCDCFTSGFGVEATRHNYADSTRISGKVAYCAGNLASGGLGVIAALAGDDESGLCDKICEPAGVRDDGRTGGDGDVAGIAVQERL